MPPVLLQTNKRIVSPWFRLAQLAAPYRWQIGLAVSLAGAACLSGLAAPLLIERLLVTAGTGEEWVVLAVPAAVLLLVVAMQNVASSANAWLLAGVALDLVRDLRRAARERARCSISCRGCMTCRRTEAGSCSMGETYGR